MNLYPNWNGWVIWIVACSSTLCFFSCLTAHELSHSLAAKYHHIQISSITLFILGGVSEIDDDFHNPTIELLVSAVGPITSLCLAGLFWVISIATYPFNEVIYITASILAYANLGLSMYNMIPASPLDGGRILKALIWLTTGNYRLATKLTGLSGIMIALTLLIGCISLFVLTNYFIIGIWLTGMGSYLLYTGFQSLKEAQNHFGQ